MKSTCLLMMCSAIPFFSTAQIQIQKGAMVYLQDHALISLQGDLAMEESVDGPGTVLFNGSRQQFINANGNALPSVFVENTRGIALSSDIKVNRQIALQSGKIILGSNNVELTDDAVASGNASAYFVTGNDGKIKKSVHKNLESFFVPVGTTIEYAPLILQSSGKYNGAQISIGAFSKINPNKPSASRDYLNNYWIVSRRGIAGELTATAFYNRVTGEQKNIKPYFWNGSEWIYKQSSVDLKNKLLSIEVPEGSGEIYAMQDGAKLYDSHTSMTLLPNPVKNLATLVVRSNEDKRITVTITDMSGTSVMSQLVWLRKGTNQIKLNVISLASGQYIVRCGERNVSVVKMIKE